MELTTYPTGKLINCITDMILSLDSDGAQAVVGDVLETRLITVPTPPKKISKHMVQVIALATIAGLKIKRERTIDADFYERYGLTGKSIKESYRQVLRWMATITISFGSDADHLISITAETRQGIIVYPEWRDLIAANRSKQPLPQDLGSIPKTALSTIIYILRQISYHKGNHRMAGQELRMSTLLKHTGYDLKGATKHPDRFIKALDTANEFLSSIGVYGLEDLGPRRSESMSHYIDRKKVNIAIRPGSELEKIYHYSEQVESENYTDQADPKLYTFSREDDLATACSYNLDF